MTPHKQQPDARLWYKIVRDRVEGMKDVLVLEWSSLVHRKQMVFDINQKGFDIVLFSVTRWEQFWYWLYAN